MLAAYEDILSAMTLLVRELHAETKALGDGPHSQCLDNIDVTTGKCRCVAVPLWYDENGTPRFAQHHPHLCPDIYADEVVLMRVSCQNCSRESIVQMSRSASSSIEFFRSGSHGRPIAIAQELWEMAQASSNDVNPEPLQRLGAEIDEIRARKPLSLADVVRDGSIHYGDPPNVDCCPAGPTMNCMDLQVIEFWMRGGPLKLEWVRVPELEIELPDAKPDPEDVTP